MKQNDILESFRARSTKLDQLRERMELLIDRYSTEDDELDKVITAFKDRYVQRRDRGAGRGNVRA